jgi:hypothetical protein
MAPFCFAHKPQILEGNTPLPGIFIRLSE